LRNGEGGIGGIWREMKQKGKERGNRI